MEFNHTNIIVEFNRAYLYSYYNRVCYLFSKGDHHDYETKTYGHSRFIYY